jgi:hypothetical protein
MEVLADRSFGLEPRRLGSAWRWREIDLDELGRGGQTLLILSNDQLGQDSLDNTQMTRRRKTAAKVADGSICSKSVLKAALENREDRIDLEDTRLRLTEPTVRWSKIKKQLGL